MKSNLNKQIKLSNKRRKWRRWIAVIRQDLISVTWDDLMFRESMKAIESNASMQPNNVVYKWLLSTHERSFLIRLRRLMDADSRTYSILNLLNQINDCPHALTKRSYLSLYPAQMRDSASETWSRELFPGNPPHADVGVIQSKIAQVKKIKKKLGPLTDKVLAHNDRDKSAVKLVRWNDAHDALHHLQDICSFLDLLLVAVGGNYVASYDHLEFDLKEAWAR